MPPPTSGSPEQALRLLFVVDSLDTGGAERSMAEFLPRLDAYGLTPSVVCLRAGQWPLEKEIVTAGIPVLHLAPAGMVGWTRQMRRLVRHERPDLVCTVLFQSDVTGRVACIGTGTPVLSTVATTTYSPGRMGNPDVSAWKVSAVRVLDGLTSRYLTSHHHAVSEAAKADTVAALGVPATRISVVPRGRDPGRLGRRSEARRNRVRSELGLDPTQPVIIAVGRQEWAKGHSHLLRAVVSLREEYPDLVTLIAGRPGAAAERLKALGRELGLGGALRILGDRADVPDLMSASDIFVLPSEYEGLPGVAIEAMALDLPVVASDLPSIREVVVARETGLLVPSRDPVALADAIGRLVGDPTERSRLGKAGRDRFEDRFQLDVAAAAMARLFREVAQEARPTRRMLLPRKVQIRGGGPVVPK